MPLGADRSQHGAVLIVSLVMLVLLTLLAVSSMSSTNLQERMAGNTSESLLAFISAEAGLHSGESWIGSPSLTSKPDAKEKSTCINLSPGVARCNVWQVSIQDSANNKGPWPTVAEISGPDRYSGTSATASLSRDATWWRTNAIAFNTITNRNLPLLAEQPRYVMEELGARNFTGSLVLDPSNTYQYYFSITTYAVGRSNNTPIVLQSGYGRIF